ncbi:MAG: DUF1802 family protein [Phormidium sp. GEM2.Bin31]|nr:MAG: DUF1802 family protein [Phormidium sp. GEM2.Bin31]
MSNTSPNTSVIFQALSLPPLEMANLLQGVSIVAIAPRFVRPKQQQFGLCISQTFSDGPEKYLYHQDILATERVDLDEKTLIIPAWAVCEDCEILNADSDLAALSESSIWTTEMFSHILAQRPNLFLAYLRVYRLPEPLVVSQGATPREPRQFLGLPETLTLRQENPVLGDRRFEEYHQDLRKRQPLDSLQRQLRQLAISQPSLEAAIQQFQQQWRGLDNTTETSLLPRRDPDLDWIERITEVGNSSDGYEFEKLVRRALLKLGFRNSEQNPKASLNPDQTGGAGGLDVYCESPYPLVGECKASQGDRVPDSTPAQLIKLGQKYLNVADGEYAGSLYERCVKVIFAAGKLTPDADQVARGNEMNVLRPETLETLIKLQANYPGSVDLQELKENLNAAPFGEEADRQLENYIQELQARIKQRADIISALKVAIDTANSSSMTVGNFVFSLKFIDDDYKYLNQLGEQGIYELLIELSSPLTGYIRREKKGDWREDCFSVIRDLSL